MAMECACMIDSGEMCDPPAVFTETLVVAKKPHTCCECGDIIQPGQQYELVKGLWDGSWSKFRTCSICARIRRAYCCSWTYGDLRADLWDALGVDYITGETDGNEEALAVLAREWAKRPKILCERCGSQSGSDFTWRWAGDRWQHRCANVHPQVGHWDMPGSWAANDEDCPP